MKDVARVELGPDERRGITEMNGDGEVAGGIVLQRFGANALNVIENVKARLSDVAASLPEGTEMVMPGDNVEMDVELIQPIAMDEGLRFAIREGGRTVGSGVVTSIEK